MTIEQAIILAIIEGLTEFLPISSTGHLILARQLLGLEKSEFATSFEIIIQLGAIMAVVVMYFEKMKRAYTTWITVLIACIPSLIIGLIGYKVLKEYLLSNDIVVVTTLIIGGVIFLYIDSLTEKIKPRTTLVSISKRQSLKIGIAQAVAIIPGVSRSAATIIGAQLVGVEKKSAVEFSFLLAVPTMLGATSLDIIASGFAFSNYEIVLLMVGLLISFITAVLAIKTFLMYIQNHSFKIFGWYRIGIACIYIFVKLLESK